MSTVSTTRVTTSGGISLLAAIPDREPTRHVLLLHGIGGNARSCRAAAELLAARGIAAYAWDAPGYGDSADPTGAVDLPAAVLGVLDTLGIDRVDLFGTSWGGVIAAQVAARTPDRIRTLTLADSTRGSGITGERAAAMRGRVAALTEAGAPAFAAGRAPKLVSPTAPSAVAEAVRTEMARVRVPGYRVAAEFMAATDNTDLLRGLTVPTLVVVGADDVVTGVAESELLATLIPGAAYAVLPDAGHSAVTERPEAMVAALTRFWEKADIHA
ncbi:alpha/beta fold hydrolase [Granulicoccus phenolivorans]|uniref:alpha/beta fold hydrolase n=1 Tax=Granulicoccus phenolivorans TaxID=266854 RepID=UPI0004082AAA|nr:alpha/beta fold hydrolase [Granulicoccus phenolivorans]